MQTPGHSAGRIFGESVASIAPSKLAKTALLANRDFCRYLPHRGEIIGVPAPTEQDRLSAARQATCAEQMLENQVRG
jgi:hypothetical protein